MTNQIEFLRTYLAGKSGHLSRIADEAGISRRSIGYVANDPARDVRYSTMQALLAWIEKNDPEALPGAELR